MKYVYGDDNGLISWTDDRTHARYYNTLYVYVYIGSNRWGKQTEREREIEKMKAVRSTIHIYIYISSILLVIAAGLRSRGRHYHHISGNVEICLYVFGGKNNRERAGARTGWKKS